MRLMRAPNSGTPAFVVSNIHVVGMVCLGNDNGRSNDRFPYRRSARPRFPSHRVPVIYGSTSFPELLVLQPATQERGADSATTGSTATPKAKLASQIETFTAAKSKPSEQPKIELTKNDALNNDTPNSQPQQTGTVRLQPALQQEANADPSTASNNTVSAPPIMPVESFDSRWSALQKSETSVEFKDRWALGSQDLWSDRIFDADCRGAACQ